MSAARPTLATSLARTINRARRRGPSEAAGALWEQLRSNIDSHGTLHVLARWTGGTPERRQDLTFRRAGPGDARAYARDIGTDSPTTFRRRLSAATHCYVVVSRGRLLHASWVTTGSAWTAELGAFISPPVGDAYIYESFTRPDARGRGIYPFALHNICAELAKRGVPRAWIATEASNEPSRRAIAKAGFEPAFELGFRRRRGKVQVERPVGPLADAADDFVSDDPRN